MTEVNEFDTERLIRHAAAGDDAAGERLLERHRQRLRDMVSVRMDSRLMARVDPSDVVQETLVAAHQRLHDYLREQPIPFYPWLRSIARNHLMDLQRRHVRSRKRSIEREERLEFVINDESALTLASRVAGYQDSPSQQLIRDEVKSRVMKTLDEMPEDQREIIVMRHLEGLSVKEIASILGMPAGTVMSRHFRGLKVLRRILDV